MTGLAILVLVVGGLAWTALSNPPASAQKPSLFAGSLLLEDSRPLPVLDLATASVTVRLSGINAEVASEVYSDVQPVPLAGGTLLVNQVTGDFNFLAQTNYVTDPNGPGVGLGALRGATAARGYPAGTDAFVVRTAPQSTVSLVGPDTVAAAARAEGVTPNRRISAAPATAVNPAGFAALDGSVATVPGSAVVSGTDLWALVAVGRQCAVERLHPDPGSHLGLDVTTVERDDVTCGQEALEPFGADGLALARPGHLRILPVDGRSRAIDVPLSGTSTARGLVPVTGAGSHAWFLARLTVGWTLVGASSSGRSFGPLPLSGLGSTADPAEPAQSGGFLYTLDRSVVGQPALWAIDTATGRMAPVSGASTYPAVANEKEQFESVQVVVDGPRIVFNNPDSVEAVVLYTDSNRPPAVVNKDSAIVVSPTGPADVNVKPTKGSPSKGSSATTTPANRPVPVVQPVSQQITCANTTQKPYVPQITAIGPSAQTALIQWSYQLLDQTDCEPDTWSVQVTALGGGHAPANPVLSVQGQTQLLFTGLRPATTYQAVVTAYINRQSTPSAPVSFTTPPRGPDAPLAVRTVADSSGDWVVSWTPCTQSANPNCVVPADQWTITGAACANSYVGSPPSVQVGGNQTSVTISAVSLQELGTSMSFSVQGSLSSGLAGNPTSDGSCTEAWSTPVAKDITLESAGQPSGNTITASLSVSVTGAYQAAALGAPAGQVDFVYSVGGRTVGPTTATTATIPGLAANQTYTPTVTIYPVGHPSASVTVTGRAFSRNLPWPGDIAQSSVLSATVSQSDPNRGTLTVTFPPGTPSGPFEAKDVSLNCGTQLSEPDVALTPAGASGRSASWPIDLVTEGGTCAMSMVLDVPPGQSSPYGGPSPQITTPSETVGNQPSYSFTVQVDQSCQNPTITDACGVTKPWSLDLLSSQGSMAAGGNWVVKACTVDHGSCITPDVCAYSSGQIAKAPSSPFVFQLPATCVDFQQVQKVDTTVYWEYLGQNQTADAGTPSGVQPPPTSTTSTTTTTTLPPCPSTTVAPITTDPCRTAGAIQGGGGGSLLAGASIRGPGAGSLSGAVVAVWVLAGLGSAGAGLAPGRRRRRRPSHPPLQKGNP